MAFISPMGYTPNFNFNTLPKHAMQFASPPQAAPATTNDAVDFSQEAQTAGLRSGPQNLMLFGGDRKKAIETLVASGAKPENPDLPWYKDVLRFFAGGKTKTVTKPISAEQSITSKVKVKNFQLKDLRLTTKTPSNDPNQVNLRHVDFPTTTPTGKKAQVKDVGTQIGKTTPTRMFEQNVEKPHQGEPGRIKNSYFDPKTGQKFLQTSEVAPTIEKDKFGAFRSKKSNNSYRQIDMLDPEGKVDQRYIFDYSAKSYRLEDLNPEGQVVASRGISKKTDYWKLVDSLSLNPPSKHVAAPPAAAAPAPVAA